MATGAGWLAGTIADMTGIAGLADPDTLRAFFLETIFGPIEAARLALLLVMTGIAYARLSERPRVVSTAIASGPVLVSQAWLGHAAEGGVTVYGTAMIAVYGVHALAGAAWLGSLPPLLASLGARRRRAASRLATLRLLSRFSTMATLAVALVVGTGIANAAFRVEGRFGAFVGTAYGDVLFVKIALVVLVLCLAVYNRAVVMPRLRASAGDVEDVVARAAKRIGGEIALGALVLLAAAILSITAPPA